MEVINLSVSEITNILDMLFFYIFFIVFIAIILSNIVARLILKLYIFSIPSEINFLETRRNDLHKQVVNLLKERNKLIKYIK